MKTYSIIYALLALVVFGCSKSGDSQLIEEKEEEKENFFSADYVLLKEDNGVLSAQLLKSTESFITESAAESSFDHVPVSDVTFMNESIFANYSELADCNGKVTLHDFNDDTATIVNVFNDMLECNLTVTSITVEGESLYIAYML